jgi:hypothetical protein
MHPICTLNGKEIGDANYINCTYCILVSMLHSRIFKLAHVIWIYI